jgi:hypothetical protein
MSLEQANLELAKQRHKEQKRLRAVFNGTLTPRNHTATIGFSMEETIAEIKRRANRQAAVQGKPKPKKPHPNTTAQDRRIRKNPRKHTQNKAA